MNEIAAFFDEAPCEAWHSEAPVGSALWSHQVTEQRYFVQPHIENFVDFPHWKGKRVLEIGCGIGTDTLKFVRAGAKVDALDFSYESVSLANDRIRAEGFQSFPYSDVAKFYWSNAESYMPLEKYDLIYSFGVLHHTPCPEVILKKAWTRLLGDGELRIMLYAKWSIKHLFGIQPEAQAGCPLVRWYSKREARKLLESCGFEVVSIEKTHIFPWRISDYREHRFVKAFPWNITPKWLFRWLESKLGHHLLLVARRSPKTANDPASV